MAYTFRLPDLGEGVTEGEIATWLVNVGQDVAEDDPLVEIQTDKTTVEIPSPVAGPVTAILAQAGDVVPVGTALIVIGGADGAARTDDRAAAAAPRLQVLPAVRRLAEELGVDLEAVAATSGRITEEDVRAAAGPPERAHRIPLAGIRRAIAEHLARAHREAAAVTVVEECDFTALNASRGSYSIVTGVLAATVDGLKKVPELNARLDGDAIVIYERYDLGLAVQTDAGLVVPVLRDADTRTPDELDAEIRRLADGARAGTLAPDELRGSTFTVTSAGRLGGLFATPLVNYPEVGILGIHRIDRRPVVRDEQIVVRDIGLVSCTFDHRVVDGARASEFVLAVIDRLQAAG
jgi:pyruvate/2-oxoglutarate dehydrogenase complex dihydrolipoamide acyltransferase (E2) component